MWAYLFRPSKGLISRFRVKDPLEVPEKFRHWNKPKKCKAFDYIECEEQTWTVVEDGEGDGFVLKPGGIERPSDSRFRLDRPDDEPNSGKRAALAAASWGLLLLALVPSWFLGSFLIDGSKDSGNAAYGYALMFIGAPIALVTGLLLLASLFCGLGATSLGEKSARVPTIGCLLIVVLLLYLFSRF